MWQDVRFRKLWAPRPHWIWAVCKDSALILLGELITHTVCIEKLATTNEMFCVKRNGWVYNAGGMLYLCVARLWHSGADCPGSTRNIDNIQVCWKISKRFERYYISIFRIYCLFSNRISESKRIGYMRFYDFFTIPVLLTHTHPFMYVCVKVLAVVIK